jgi:hypothetical protein
MQSKAKAEQKCTVQMVTVAEKFHSLLLPAVEEPFTLTRVM